MCSRPTEPLRTVERLVVLANERVTTGVGLLVLHAPLIASRIEPGQFVHLRIAADVDFILRRPFSVHRAGNERIEILYQVLGRGTRELSLADPGAEMNAIGPLGSGWEIPDGAAHALLVAGGLGIAPMGMLLERLSVRGIAATVAQGGPNVSRLLARELVAANARRVLTATEDGSEGVHGLVTELSATLLPGGEFDVVFVCGPEAMCRVVAEQASAAGVPCQVSLERLMACGVGACLSCVVSTTEGLRKACTDGPVFDAARIMWDPSEIPPRH